MRDLATGENRLLTSAKGGAPAVNEGYAGSAIFSPDGKQIAYNWYQLENGEASLRLIGADGTHMSVLMREVSKDPGVYAWSPDGKQIAIALLDYVDRTNQISLISAQDGSLRRLKSTGWRKPLIGGFSPDGKYLVYSVPNSPELADGGIFIIATDGKREAVVVQGKSIDSSPVWTPDGRTIVFSSDRDGTKGLWSIQVADGNPNGSPELVRGNMGVFVNMGFSRNGSYFYGLRKQQTDIFVADFNQEMLQTTAAKRLTDRFVGSNSGIAWSPDGKWFAFVRSGLNQQAQTLVIRSVQTGEERILPTKFERPLGPVLNSSNWFPDSRSLMVADINKHRRVFRRIDIETGQDRVVYDAPAGVWPLVRL